MNYYRRHIGDYTVKAAHLSMLEHGAFNILIDRYYNAEQAPSRAVAIRWTRATTPDELAALDAVLAEFFTEVDGLFIQGRIEEELTAFRGKQEANRILGARGGQANAKRIATQTLSESEANGEANDKPSHKPIANSQERAEATSRKPRVSPEAVIEAYHEILPRCQRVSVLTPERRRKVIAAEKLALEICARYGWDYGQDFWRDFFRECAKDAYYAGETSDPKFPNFKQNLGVLLRPEHFARIMDSALAGVEA